jgi:hypothetical protein
MKKAVVAGGCVVVAITGIVCYRLGKARADGIPADADALSYTGYLEDGNGQPVSATLPINVALYAQEQLGQAVCETNPGPTPKSVTVEKGRFRVGLPAACVVEVRKGPNLWVQVNVGTEALGPRTRIGAVAFAVEAGHAAVASTARRVVLTGTTTSVSSGGAYCGTTTPVTGNLGGYEGVKALCVAACGNDPTAHMCFPDEVVRSHLFGLKLDLVRKAPALQRPADRRSRRVGNRPFRVELCAAA